MSSVNPLCFLRIAHLVVDEQTSLEGDLLHGVTSGELEGDGGRRLQSRNGESAELARGGGQTGRLTMMYER